MKKWLATQSKVAPMRRHIVEHNSPKAAKHTQGCAHDLKHQIPLPDGEQVSGLGAKEAKQKLSIDTPAP